MPDIPVRDFLARIEECVRLEEFDQAIAQAKHLLAFFPECIAAHRLLGEACLGEDQLPEAQESFERVLAADPESSIAHIGLSLVRDRQGRLPEAISHMERAFDIASGNAEVRTELQALYARRGDSRRASPALTRGAMARIYAQNGLLDRAIEEYQEALRQNPELPDLRAGLLEVQWRTGRKQEAWETCRALLDRQPGCLKALLVEGRRLMESGHAEEAEAVLGRAHALDPENRAAQRMMGDAPLLPLGDALVPDLGAQCEGPGDTAAPRGSGDDEAVGRAPDEPGAVRPSRSRSRLAVSAVAAPPAPLEDAASGLEPPEWLQGMPERAAPRNEAPATESEGAPGPEWLDTWEGGPPGQPQTMPEETPVDRPPPPAWLGEEAGRTPPGEAAAAPKTPAQSKPPGAELVPSPEAIEAVPDWVRRMEEVMADDGPAAGTDVLPPALGAPEERQRIRELLLLLQKEPGKYWTRIELARMLCHVGDWDGALLQYEELIAGHKLIRAVIADLQGLLHQDTDSVQVYRLLGDAYMESDQIDQALEMYRLARQMLRRR